MSRAPIITILFASALALFVATLVSPRPTASRLLQTTYLEVCRLVQENYYKEGPELEEWTKNCFQSAWSFDFSKGLNPVMSAIDSSLGELAVSHLSLWDPLAMRSQWLGESRETGIRTRKIDGHYIITQLVDDGPALRAGLKIGDEIVKIGAEPIKSDWDVRSRSGLFQILRDGNTLVREIQVDVLRVDGRPTFEAIDSTSGVLNLPSFIPFYFEKDEWKAVIDKFQDMESLIVDLRGNSGGNFAAMLRALSPFFCEPTIVGRLDKPRRQGNQSFELEDNTEADYQKQLIEMAPRIYLRTFKDYGCFKGRVTVLIDRDSASTTEVFAQAMLKREGTRVWGDFSAGEVVQAVWYPLPLGTAFALSIPDSMFFTPEEQSLEGVGVRPQKVLSYSLEEARQGVDSWIQSALLQ